MQQSRKAVKGKTGSYTSVTRRVLPLAGQQYRLDVQQGLRSAEKLPIECSHAMRLNDGEGQRKEDCECPNAWSNPFTASDRARELGQRLRRCGRPVAVDVQRLQRSPEVGP